MNGDGHTPDPQQFYTVVYNEETTAGSELNYKEYKSLEAARAFVDGKSLDKEDHLILNGRVTE